jgi:hypothetical protein
MCRLALILALSLIAIPAQAVDYIIRAASQAAMVQGLLTLGLVPGATAITTKFTSPYLQGTDSKGDQWFVVHAAGGTGSVMVPTRNPAGWTSSTDANGNVTWTAKGPVVTTTVNGLPVPTMAAYDTGFWCVMRWLGPNPPVFPASVVVQPANTLNPDVMAGITVIE